MIRQHSAIGYVSPAEFEKKVGLTELTVHRTGSGPLQTEAQGGMLKAWT